MSGSTSSGSRDIATFELWRVPPGSIADSAEDILVELLAKISKHLELSFLVEGIVD